MSLLSEDIDEVTRGICAKVDVRVTMAPVPISIYKASPKKVAEVVRSTLSQVPIDELSEEVIAKHCLRTVELEFRHVFRFYPPGDPERTCKNPEVYELKCKLTKYTKPMGFYIKFI